MASVVNIRSSLRVFFLSLVCASFSGTIAEAASADICDRIEDARRETSAKIEYIYRQLGQPMDIAAEASRLDSQFRAMYQAVNNPLTAPDGVRQAERFLARYPAESREIHSRLRAVTSRTRRLSDFESELLRQYTENRCQDRPRRENPPGGPPGCAPAAAGDLAPAPPATGETRRLANRLLMDLLAPSDVPVFARVLADGRVVDYVTGVPVVNPAYRDVPVSVDFHPGSPFAAGQAVWVSFYTSHVSGVRVSLASFASSTGQPLVYAPNDARVVTEVPSVWEVFPNGLVVIPSVPAGAGAAVRAAQPLGEYMLRAPGGVRAVFERLQQLLEGFRSIPSPVSDRRRPGSANGCHAVFVLGKTKVVGKSCSRNAPFGRWEWKAFSETTDSGGGISAKWSESYSRSEGFKPLSGVRVFVHQNTDEEVAGWSPEKLGDYRLALPVLAGKYARAFKNWNAQLATGGRHAGKIIHQVSNRWGGGEVKQIRSTPLAGCDIAPLEGYKERNIPQ